MSIILFIGLIFYLAYDEYRNKSYHEQVEFQFQSVQRCKKEFLSKHVDIDLEYDLGDYLRNHEDVRKSYIEKICKRCCVGQYDPNDFHSNHTLYSETSRMLGKINLELIIALAEQGKIHHELAESYFASPHDTHYTKGAQAWFLNFVRYWQETLKEGGSDLELGFVSFDEDPSIRFGEYINVKYKDVLIPLEELDAETRGVYAWKGKMFW